MTVNFNNVRAQACFAYDRLVEKLNAAILKESQWATPNDVSHGQDIDIRGNVLIDAEDIQDDLETLRQTIGTIAMCYEEGNPEVRDVYQEHYPQPKSLAIFNPEKE